MASDRSKLPEQVVQPVEAPSELPPDDGFAAELRGFGPLGILAILFILLTGNISLDGVMLPVGALLTLTWMRLSRTPWHEIGYAHPRSWIGAVVAGVAFGDRVQVPDESDRDATTRRRSCQPRISLPGRK